MAEPLSLETIDELLKSVSFTVAGIVLWRKKIKRLKDELAKQEVIEDDVIYDDLYRFLKRGKYGELPLTRTFPIDGVDVKVTIAHRHKGESVFGVDLVYEVTDTKIALLQYKKSNQGRFAIDRMQHRKLRHFCYDGCMAKKVESRSWFHEKSRIVAFCPCYYYLIGPKDELIMPACVFESIFDSKSKGRNSANADEFHRGISREPFIEIFSKCWIGAIYPLKENVDLMMDILLLEDHMIVHCKENEGVLEETNVGKV